MLTDAQQTHLQMERLVAENYKEKAQQLQNFTNNLFQLASSGVGLAKTIKDANDVKENAEVDRAYNIANAYMSNKIQNDKETQADFGEQKYRESIANYDITTIQSIQEMNLSDGAKQKLINKWNTNKPNIMGNYDIQLLDFNTTQIKREYARFSQLLANDTAITSTEKAMQEYNDYSKQVNPNNIPFQGKNSPLLDDEMKTTIIGGTLANIYNSKRNQIGFNPLTALDDVIKEEKEKLKSQLTNKDKTDTKSDKALSDAFIVLSNLENDKIQKNEIIATADKREQERITNVTSNANKLTQSALDTINTKLNDYYVENNKEYILDTTTDENGNYTNDQLGILQYIKDTVNYMTNLNLSPSQTLALQDGSVGQFTQRLSTLLTSSILESDSIEKAREKLGLTQNSDEISTWLMANTDIQEKLKNLYDFAQKQNIDLSTQQGRDAVKIAYQNLGDFTDNQIGKIYNVRKAYDFFDNKTDLIKYISQFNLDNETQERLVKEYDSTKSKYAPVVKEHLNTLKNEKILPVFKNNKDYRNKIGMTDKDTKLPLSFENKIEDVYYNFLINNSNLDYKDPRVLDKLDIEISNAITEYADKSVNDFFKGMYRDLDDMDLSDENTFKFLKGSQENLFFKSGFDNNFNFLTNYTDLKDEDLKKTDNLRDLIAKKQYGVPSYDNLTWMQQVETQGGIILYRAYETQRRQIENDLKTIKADDYLKASRVVFSKDGMPFYELEDNRKDKENESKRNNIGIYLIPSTYLTNGRLKEQDIKVKEKGKGYGNEYLGDEWEEETTKIYKQDYYYLVFAKKDKNGNIDWNTTTWNNGANNVNTILKVVKDSTDNFRAKNIIDYKRDVYAIQNGIR